MSIRRVFYVLTPVLAVCVVAFFLWYANPAAVWSHIKHFGAAGFGAFVTSLALYAVFGALGWWVILRINGHRVSVADAIIGRVMGVTVSLITPSMYVGGEPVRILYVKRKYGIPAKDIAATVIVDKAQEITGFLLFVQFSAVFVFLEGGLSAGVKWVMAVFVAFATVLLALILVAFLTNFLVFRRIVNAVRYLWAYTLPGLIRGLGYSVAAEKPFTVTKPAGRLALGRRVLFIAALPLYPFFYLLRWLRFMPFARVMRRFGLWVEAVEDTVHTTLWRNKRLAALALFFNILNVFFIFIKPYIYFVFAEGTSSIGLSKLCSLFGLSQIVLAVQFTPAGIGLYEGGILGIFNVLGLDKNQATAFLGVTRAADVLLIAVGLFLVFRFGLAEVLKKVVAPGRRDGENIGSSESGPESAVKGPRTKGE